MPLMNHTGGGKRGPARNDPSPCETWDTNWARSRQPTARVVESRDVSSSLSSTRSSWQLLSASFSAFSRQNGSAGWGGKQQGAQPGAQDNEGSRDIIMQALQLQEDAGHAGGSPSRGSSRAMQAPPT